MPSGPWTAAWARRLAEHDQVIAAQAERPRSRADHRLELLGDLADSSLGVPGRHQDISEVSTESRPNTCVPAPRCAAGASSTST